MANDDSWKKEPPAIQTVFSVWNTMIGSSILSLAWAFDNGGVAGSIVIIVFMWFVTFYPITIIIRTRHVAPTEHPEKFRLMAGSGHSIQTGSHDHSVSQASSLLPSATDFADTCESVLGTAGRIAAWLGSVLTLVGATFVYDILFTTNFYSVVLGVHDLIYHVHSPSSSSSSDFDSSSEQNSLFHKLWTSSYVPIYFAVLFFPLLCFRRMERYVKMSSCGIVGMLSVVVVVITASIINWAPSSVKRTWTVKPRVSYLAGIMCLAFFVHNFILQVTAHTRSTKKALRNVTIGFGLGGITYAVIGTVTYVALGPGVPQDIFDRFPNTDILPLIGRFALLFQIGTVLPFIVCLLRVQLFSTVPSIKKRIDNPPLVPIIIFDLVVMTLATLLSIFYPRVGDVIRITGPVCALVYVFSLPALVHFIIKKKKNHGKIPVFALIFDIAFVLVGVTVLLFQFVKLG